MWKQLSLKRYLRTCAPSEDSDQPAHSHSLIRIFIGCVLHSQGCEVPSCKQRRLWSDCTDADLNLRWAHVSRYAFSRVRSKHFDKWAFAWRSKSSPSSCVSTVVLRRLWSDFAGALRVSGGPVVQQWDCEDFDQTAPTRRLISVVVLRSCPKVQFLTSWTICISRLNFHYIENIYILQGFVV